MPEVERKYNLECKEYDNVVFGISEEFSGSAKLEQEKLAKLAEGGDLQALLDVGTFQAVERGSLVKQAGAVVESVTDFEKTRDKAVDTIMATKITQLPKK